jgi:hypothetical protein
VFVGLAIASYATTSLPGYTDSNATVTRYFLHHHREGQLAMVLEGLGLIAFLWLIGTLTSALRVYGQGHLAAIAFGAGLIAIAIGAFNTIIVTALSLHVAEDSPNLVKGLYDLRATASTLLAFPLAALTAATALAMFRGRLVPVWYGIVSAITGLITLGRGSALAAHGFYAPGGGYGLATSVAILFWALTTSFALAFAGPAPQAELAD